jgi:hypothetical protein
MKFSTKEIRQHAAEILEGEPRGIRYSDLCKRIQEQGPETNMNTIRTQVGYFVTENPNIVARPSRGVMILKKFASTSGELKSDEDVPVLVEAENAAPPGQATRLPESAFYEPFAHWLVEEGVVSISHVVGGAGFKSKWGTPDVIGVYKPQPSDIVKFPMEIVSVEIKVDPIGSVVAFGQACAYRLFSHKTYIVMPTTIAPADQDRLDALCEIYGVGLVLFDLNVDEPDFRFVRKAQRFSPDMYYVNDFARRLHDLERTAFDRLF